MKPHRTDGVSLTFALLFLAIAGWWFIAQLFDLPLPAVGWFVAGALIFLGALGLIGALRSGKGEPTPPPAAEPAPTPEPAIAPVSGLPAELHADIVRELLAAQAPYLPPVSGAPEVGKPEKTQD